MKKRLSKGKKALIGVLSAIITLFLVVGVVSASIYFSVKLDSDSVVAEKATLVITDMQGNEIDSDALNRYVRYDEISTDIINAFVALEDKRFFNHKGVDVYRMLGATVKNIKCGYFKEGGSTITQQLAKNTQLSNEKTLVRKIKEIRLAREIEKKYSKEEIIEMYLNAIYYGNGIYGIDSACKKYFDKSPAEIGLSEAAILSGIVKSPSVYSPTVNKEKATERMQLVLKLMLEQKLISEDEYKEAVKYEYKQPQSFSVNPYFACALSECCGILGMSEKEIIKSGYRVSCEYDNDTQNILKRLIDSGEFNISTYGGDKALFSIVVCDNKTGGIIASLSSNGTIATEIRRMPGSTIKPIAVYSPALEKGVISEATRLTDEKTDFGGYIPENYKNIYYGNIDAETAVMKSINTVAVKVFVDTGKEYCIQKTVEAGIKVDKNDNNLSFALGGMTYGTTPRELCGAYMCLANGGNYRQIGCVNKIVDKEGTLIYKRDSREKRVFFDSTAAIMTDMLCKTAQNGTAKKLSKLNFEIAAKTGTVGGGVYNTDAWCMSYSPEYTVCVWFGGKDLSDSENIDVTGGGIPTLLTSNIYDNLKINKRFFEMPDSVSELTVDTYGIEENNEIFLASEYTPQRYKKEYLFSENNLPTSYSPYFSVENVEIQAVKSSESIVLNVKTSPPFSYRIYRKELITETDGILIAEILPEETASEHDISDNITEVGKTYLYILEIIMDGAEVTRRYATVLS